MSNLFQDIKDIDDIISDLKYNLKFEKNKNKANKRISKLYNIRNNYDNVLCHNFKLDTLNALILSNLKAQIMSDKGHLTGNIDLNFYLKQTATVIQDGYEQKLSELSSIIKGGLDAKYLNEDKDILKCPKKETISNRIVELLGILKQDIWMTKA